MSFHPYLFFSNSECAEAFRFYHEVLGGELYVMTHADLPPDAEPMPGAEPHHVMHAAITLNGSLLMASDDPTGTGGPKEGVAISYTAEDEAEVHRVFDALAEGGRVDMPVEATFWAPAFGGVTDRFGVAWLVSCDHSE